MELAVVLVTVEETGSQPKSLRPRRTRILEEESARDPDALSRGVVDLIESLLTRLTPRFGVGKALRDFV